MWEELVCLLLILCSVHVCRHVHMCVDAYTGICPPVCAAFINSDDKMEPIDLAWILASVLCLWKIGSGI